MKILNRGAEAVLFLGTREGEKVVVKERIKKGYRVQPLDEAIRRKRTAAEVSIMVKARRFGVPVPRVLEEKDSSITLEYIEGETARDAINNPDAKSLKTIAAEIGGAVAKLHGAGIAHGDLTTSNMVLQDGKVFLIDFGLSKNSSKVEDQAIDIYLLYEAVRAAHFNFFPQLWRGVVSGYEKGFANSGEVLKRLEAVSKRRRYKTE